MFVCDIPLISMDWGLLFGSLLVAVLRFFYDNFLAWMFNWVSFLYDGYVRLFRIWTHMTIIIVRLGPTALNA